MSAPQSSLVESSTSSRPKKRLSFKLFTAAIVLVLCCLSVVLFWVWRKLSAVQGMANDAAYNQFVTDYNSGTDFVQPTVNTIQFLRRGYSIVFDTVDYTQNGLALTGHIGNPNQLWVSSLALSFSARPWPYKIKEKWMEHKYFFWLDEWNIGTAQTTVGFLNPGSTQFFTVTIPNVKQTSEGFEIAVSFSGERYQYLGH